MHCTHAPWWLYALTGLIALFFLWEPLFHGTLLKDVREHGAMIRRDITRWFTRIGGDA